MSTAEDRKRREVEIGLANNAFGAGAGAVATRMAYNQVKGAGYTPKSKLGSRAVTALGRLGVSPKKAILAAGGANVAAQAANGLLDAQSAHYFARERLNMPKKKVAKAWLGRKHLEALDALRHSDDPDVARRAFQIQARALRGGPKQRDLLRTRSLNSELDRDGAALDRGKRGRVPRAARKAGYSNPVDYTTAMERNSLRQNKAYPPPNVFKASFDPYTGQMTVGGTTTSKPAQAGLYGGAGAAAGAGAGYAAGKWMPKGKGRHALPKKGKYAVPAALALGGVGVGSGLSKAEEAAVSRVEGVRNGAGRRIVEEPVAKARRFDAEADRQRRLGVAAGLGLGGAALLGNEAYRASAPAKGKWVVGDKDGRLLRLPKGKKGPLLAAGALASGGVGLAAAKRGVSERNRPWT